MPESTIRIDTEFHSIIPALSPQELQQLEATLIADGCRDALIVWDGILLDGHNRLTICRKHGIDFRTTAIELPNRTAAKVWIIRNQFARRNLSPFQRAELALKLEPMLAEQANQRMLAGKAIDPVETLPQGKTRDAVAEMASISGRTLAKVKVILAAADEATKAKLVKGDTTIDREYRLLKRQFAPMPKAGPLPSGKYRVLYADPPWKYGDQLTQDYGPTRFHYPAMTTSELCEMPIADLAEPDAVLFLWVTSPFLEDAFKIMRTWGFTYKASFIWDKVKHNYGHYNSVRHEFLLVCTRGQCLPENSKLFDSVQTIERAEKHSEKPEEFRHIIDLLYPSGERLELFARKQTKGWTTYGNELEPET